MGRIQRQSDSVQLSFIRLMCAYWHNECSLTVDEAILECGADNFETLIRNKIIGTHDSEFISISFLDEQLKGIKIISEVNRKSAFSRWNKKGNATASDRNATASDSSSSGMRTDADKIRKEKIIEDKITERELIEYAIGLKGDRFCEKKLELLAKDAHQHYTLNNWIQKNGNEIKQPKLVFYNNWFKKARDAGDLFPRIGDNLSPILT